MLIVIVYIFCQTLMKEYNKVLQIDNLTETNRTQIKRLKTLKKKILQLDFF